MFCFFYSEGKGGVGWCFNGRLNWFYFQTCILSVILFDTYD